MKIALWFIAVSFAIEQNIYFGGNWTPRSDAELVTDGIVSVLFALAALGSRA